MANGIRGLAFPTFGAKQGTGGVTPVQIPQVRTAFPTARGPVRRAPEPTTTEKVAGILPLLLQGGVNFFRGRQPQMTVPEYIKSIGADPEDLSREEQAQIAAFTAFGPQQDVGGFKGQDLLSAVVASQMGRGAPEFIRSTLNVRTADNQRKRLINQQRGELIENFLKPPTYDYATLIDVNAAQNDVNPFVAGRKNNKTGELEILNPDGSFKLAGDDYIQRTGTGNITIPKSPNVTLMADIFDPIYEKEKTATGLLSIYKPLRAQLAGFTEDDIVPGTLTSAFAGLVNQGVIEFNNINKFMKGSIFAGDADIQSGTAGNDGRAGLGTVSKGLYTQLQKGEVSTDNQEFKNFENMIKQETGKSVRDILGDVVYNDVRLRSRFLQLAYVAAAVNGQTGRTLSDKDLAYHIEIVGLGQTSDPRVLIRNLDSFVGDSINGIDDDVRLAIAQNFPKISSELEDTYVQSHLNDFYAPNTPNVYANTLEGYTFRPFEVRRPGLQISGILDSQQSSTIDNKTFNYDEFLQEEQKRFE
tara:strand:- start:227 stop:1810 length:1584 start_codon:yes stop_codon:yes gene_type:complete